ncbi:MAG: N-acetylmuramoyl-L-alanine amidase [Verrucomicrobiales bacterium]
MSDFSRDTPSWTRRLFLTAALALACPRITRADWTLVKVDGRDYVPGSDLKKFYAFKDYSIKGNSVVLSLDGFILRGAIGSKEITIRGIKFVMSFPLVKHGNEALFSRTDLVKLLDPVLRPDYIKGAPDFDTVVIDPGHGGHDSGARGLFGVEKDFALKTALLVGAILKSRGYKIVFTRSNDTFVTLQGRAAIANRYPKGIFVSIHFNQSDGREARGIETFALSPAGTSSTIQRWAEPNLAKRRGNLRDAENIALATAVHNGVLRRVKATKPEDRGIKRARFSVISGVAIPGLLFEGGFVSNAIEGKYVAHPTYQKMLAEGIVVGIENYRRAIKK